MSYRVISRVSARLYSEHMSVPGYPPAPAPGTPPVPGWSGSPGVGRAAPAFGPSIPQSRPAYPPYPMYPGYPAYSAPPASYAYPPRPATAVGTGPSYPTPTPSAPASPVPSTTTSLSQSQRRALEVTLAVLRSVGLFILCFLGVSVTTMTASSFKQA